MKTLEQYLHESFNNGAIDHVVRAQVSNNGCVSFYIHPLGSDGDTLDFDVKDNRLFAAQVAQPDGTYVIEHASAR